MKQVRVVMIVKLKVKGKVNKVKQMIILLMIIKKIMIKIILVKIIMNSIE